MQLAVRIAAELETHIVSLERIEEYMNCPEEVDNLQTPNIVSK